MTPSQVPGAPAPQTLRFSATVFRRGRSRRRPPHAAARPRLLLGVALAVGAAASTFARRADAQQSTFHLDRLEVPGAPDDGVVLFRPVTEDKPTFYAQLGLGYSANPLRTSDITSNPAALGASSINVISTQISTYLSLGFELLDRITIGGTFPAAWIEAGHQPNYPVGIFGANSAPTAFSTTGPAIGDTRLDVRVVAWRTDTAALGVQLSLIAPTGTSTNFGGDGPQFEWLPMVTGEWTPPRLPIPLTFVANTGIELRHDNSINDPVGHNGAPSGLGVGDEWRWAVGALMPLFFHRFRVGLTIFGQTGLKNDSIVGNTIFTSQNTPIEWNGEARIRLPSFFGHSSWYAGASVGTRLSDGYGAPDFRLVALLGMALPIEGPPEPSPEARIRASIETSMRDTDGDGIPDDVDACPNEPEDHKDPDPNDGCPTLDRDGDGIPDKVDQCPDEPEDKDGVQDADGCPEVDADHDGIPDVQDACPKEPGQPDPDPKKNGCPKFIHLEGSSVRVLQQVHFQTASATILPDSFPMLQEIVLLLKANPDIKRLRIEGHTDNRGNADYNLDLSKRRAASVKQWLADHGIAADRLESEGYGLTRPVATNDTDAGRAQNRRVEFKILEGGSDRTDTGGQGPSP